jgi:translation initiation factor 5A
MVDEKKIVSVGSIKKGSYVVIDGVACRVTNTSTSRPGKHGHAKVRLEAIGLIDGRKREKVMPGHDNIEAPVIDKRNAQILSIHEDVANVMDIETYETFDMKIPEDLKGQIVEGTTVLYWSILGQKIMKQIKGD